MSKTLATAVHLTDDSGIVHSFLPGSTPPKWARKQITNPKAWNGSADGEVVEEDASAGAEDAETDADSSEVSESIGDASDGSIPRRNASTDAWRAYADVKGFESDEDMTRAEIIAALDAAGIPTK